MLKISRLADYAIVILQSLSQKGRSCSAAFLAKETDISLPTVSKVLKRLAEVGILASIRGTQGGYLLISSPDKISLTAIISAIDGDFALTECCKNTQACDKQSNCQLSHNWQIINQIIANVLTNLSLADLSQRHFCFEDIAQSVKSLTLKNEIQRKKNAEK